MFIGRHVIHVMVMRAAVTRMDFMRMILLLWRNVMAATAG